MSRRILIVVSVCLFVVIRGMADSPTHTSAVASGADGSVRGHPAIGAPHPTSVVHSSEAGYPREPRADHRRVFASSLSTNTTQSPSAPPGDLLLWRPSDGLWRGTNPGTPDDPQGAIAKAWGSSSTGDVPVVGDLDGDGTADLGVFRDADATWYWLVSSNGYAYPGSAKQFGQSGDHPFLGDIDGDHCDDLIVWRPSNGTWYWRLSSNGYAEPSPSTAQQKPWGSAALGDIPLVGDLDGDGRVDLLVWRPGEGMWYWLYYLRSSDDYSYESQGNKQWGSEAAGDVPLTADLDGDGKSDLVVWRASTGTWFWLLAAHGFDYTLDQGSKQWGSQAYGDTPLLGDLDGDGCADLIVRRSSDATWYWLTSSSGFAYANQHGKVQGMGSDVPFVARRGVVRLIPPTLTDQGTAPDPVTATLSTPTPGAHIIFTVDGTTPSVDANGAPTGSSAQYSGSLTVSGTTQLRALSYLDGYPLSALTSKDYPFDTAAPTIAPNGGGPFSGSQTVILHTDTPAAEIYYTTDGSTPTSASAHYAGAFALATTSIVKAIAVRTGWTSSAVVSASFTFHFGALSAAGISPNGGSFRGYAAITLSSIAGATIRYTVDGTDPTTASTAYAAPFELYSSATLKAKAWHPDYSESPVTTSPPFTIGPVATPFLLPGSGNYRPGQLIAVTSATPGATIRYTVDGTDPTSSSATVPGSGTIAAGDFTLKAKAWKNAATPSAIVSATYSTTGQYSPTMVAGGETQAFGLRPDGSLWAWGGNASGILGDGTTTTRLNPMPVPGLTGVRWVSGGADHSLALMNDGTVKAWGANTAGQIGDGSGTGRWSPVSLSTLTDVVAVEAGGSHSVALHGDGSIVTWGLNGQGQLGDGTTANRNLPTAVPALSNVVAVSAGADHTLALKSDGTVWTWGGNAHGQLGDGTTTNRAAPGQVSGLTSIAAIAAGKFASLALKADGTVWGWGWNSSGQLGDGSTTDRSTPVEMSGVTEAMAIAVGSAYAVVLRSDNTVWTTGDNASGQLGTPSSPGRTTVAQVAGLPAVVAIAAADLTAFAVTSDGSAWAWGDNINGTIADGTQTQRTAPTAIAGPGLEWRPWMGAISIAGGAYSAEQSPVVNNGDLSAVMHYTLSGLDPTAADSIVTAAATIAITQSETLKLRSFKSGAPPSEVSEASYALKAVAPVLSPSGGTYATSQSVTVSTTTIGTTTHYTVDGNLPTGGSPTYMSPLTLVAPTTVRAMATRTGWTPSDVTTATYSIPPQSTLTAPTISPAAGTYGLERTMSITAAELGATIRYTTDGSDPTNISPAYERPFMINRSVTVKARTFLTGYAAGPAASSSFTIVNAGLSDPPDLSVAGGRYTTQRSVTVTGFAGATLRYTTNGVDPTNTDTTITSGGTITVGRSMVLKVRAWQSGLAPSVVRREDYIITGAIAAGQGFSMALKADGTVWTWGFNGAGQLGDGTTTSRNSPGQIAAATLSNVTAVAAGANHALALKADGTVWAWGYNAQGQIGNNTFSNQTSPTQVAGLTNVVAIAASVLNSYAVRSDGTVYGWGWNQHKELGNGFGDVASLVPVAIEGVAGVGSIVAGGTTAGGFALALVTNGAVSGSVWAWGRNNSGQLGDGTTTDRPVPQQVPGAAGVSAMFAGLNWVAARTAGDELLLWGGGDFGQQANGGRTIPPGADFNNYLPTRSAPWVAPLAGISGGAAHVLALDKSGRAWGWGINQNCELAPDYRPSDRCLEPRLSAERIGALTNTAALVGGVGHTLALNQSGQLLTWGLNSSGELGTGSTSDPMADPQDIGFSVVDNSWLTGDPDGDGLSTWREYVLGTDPLSADTDGDGVPDGAHPDANPDPDGDGLSNALEALLGTDPFNPDSDGDGVLDGADAYPLDPVRWQPLSSDPNDHTPPIITLIYPSSARPSGGGW